MDDYGRAQARREKSTTCRTRAVQNMGCQWLTGWQHGQLGGSRWESTGRGMMAGHRPGQNRQDLPRGGGRMRMLGGDSTREATGSVAADRVRNALKEAACPAEEAPS